MSKQIHVIKAAVAVTIPVVCCKCGKRASSEPIRIEVADMSVADLATTLNSVQLGTHFPVGWGQFYSPGGNVQKCPDCVHD